MNSASVLGTVPLNPPVRIEMALCQAPGQGFRVDVHVDGVLTTLDTPWDALALIASARRPGGYYLGNCDCGVPRCAGILAPVMVSHDGGTMTWSVPQPYAPAAGTT